VLFGDDEIGEGQTFAGVEIIVRGFVAEVGLE